MAPVVALGYQDWSPMVWIIDRLLGRLVPAGSQFTDRLLLQEKDGAECQLWLKDPPLFLHHFKVMWFFIRVD